MKKEILEIPIPLKNGKTIYLKIKGSSKDPLFLMEGADAVSGEAPNQLMEGKSYDYRIEDGFYLENIEGIIAANGFNKSIGRISPNIYVGTLAFDVFRDDEIEKYGTVKLEVQSIKTSYREDYRKMLSDITDQCIELVFQHSSPVTQAVEADYEKDARILYQRFAFIKSILDSEQFSDAVHKIISSPVTKWEESEIDKDIRGVRRLNNKALRQISSARNRLDVPKGHPLEKELGSVPRTITINYKVRTVDTPENRFVKYALRSFLSVVSELKSKTKEDSKIRLEASVIEDHLEQLSGHAVFKEISNLETLVLNSPILQRKEGYREVLKDWLMFQLAAQLTWEGGNDVYDIGKRNVAILYEYWLFFQLLKIIENVFGVKPSKNLIIDTDDKLGLQLKQGKCFAVEGVCEKYSRNLAVQFSYNRTFKGSPNESSYPDGGSWTRSMRPDYTLSMWPHRINNETAEKEELIVHIHFDAKYKIENILESLGEVGDLDEEKIEQSKGTYKRADLLKMHSYKDAIRRTGGAYILYPGKEKAKYNRMGFREIIPGLGAFQITPSESNDNGSKELESFIEDVVYHFVNRASQREKTAFRTYDIHKNQPRTEDEVREPLPELYGSNRGLIPDETFVLVGFYKSTEHLEWIRKNRLYNTRTGTGNGSIRLEPNISGAKYLLLHGPGNSHTDILFRLSDKGPRIYSKEDLEKKNYPEPSQKFYLVFESLTDCEREFKGKKWNVAKFDGYKEANAKAWPFCVSLTELMKQKL